MLTKSAPPLHQDGAICERDAVNAPTRWSELYGGEVAWVKGDPPAMLKVVQQTKKPCFVYKLLADGHLTQRQDTVEAQFKYVMANIKSTDAMVRLEAMFCPGLFLKIRQQAVGCRG